MIRKFAALMVVALSAVIVPLTTAQHAEAAYGPKVPTHLAIKVVVAKTGHPLKFSFKVTASDGTSPSGDVAYTIVRAHAAARTAQVAGRATAGNVAVSGSAVQVTGPVGRAGGTYVVTGHFTPSKSAVYLGSSNSLRTSLKGAGGQHPSNGGGGGLPNTGGPDLGWLLAGLALAGAGAGTVAYARRRTPAAA